MGRNGGHMAEDNPAKDPAGTATEPNQEPDYKALYEQALADAEKEREQGEDQRRRR